MGAPRLEHQDGSTRMGASGWEHQDGSIRMEQVLLAHSPIKLTFQLFPTLGYRGLNADVSMHAQCVLELAALILLCKSKGIAGSPA